MYVCMYILCVQLYIYIRMYLYAIVNSLWQRANFTTHLHAYLTVISQFLLPYIHIDNIIHLHISTDSFITVVILTKCYFSKTPPLPVLAIQSNYLYYIDNGHSGSSYNKVQSQSALYNVCTYECMYLLCFGNGIFRIDLKFKQHMYI